MDKRKLGLKGLALLTSLSLAGCKSNYVPSFDFDVEINKENIVLEMNKPKNVYINLNKYELTLVDTRGGMPQIKIKPYNSSEEYFVSFIEDIKPVVPYRLRGDINRVELKSVSGFGTENREDDKVNISIF